MVVLHRQLKSILGPRAAQSPLGAALLPRGRETLERAATVWQEDKKSELAGQAKAALAEWGEASPPPLALRHGAARGELKRALNSSAAGRCMAAANPVRALDVFEIPFPEEGLEALIACLDEAGRLDDLYITYRAGMNEYLTDPAHFAQLFEEGRVTGTESQKATGLRGRIYRIDDWTCEVTLVKHGAGLGALVHFGTGKQTQAWETLARDFGALNLDRTFEQTRFRCMPEQRKDTLVVSQPAVLAQIDKPVPALTTKQVVISRSKERDLIAEFAIEYNIDDRGCPPLHQVALPLWTRYGTPEIRGTADDQGGHLALVWEDGRTHYTLRLPYEAAQPVHFEVSDRQSSENSAQREATVLALDHAERKARVQAGKAIARLPRQLEQFELGMSRAQVTDVLPTGQAILKRAVPGMIIVTFAGEPARDEKYVIRQLFVRFANDDRAAEIRVRYADGPGAAVGGNWMAEIQSGFRKRAGSPLESPAAWASLWSDLSGRKSAARRYEWQDDLTQLMYQFDPAGVEVCLSDRPLEQVSGSGLPALEYLPRGTAGCLLDAGRNTLLQNLGITKPTTSANGALVINPPTAIAPIAMAKNSIMATMARRRSPERLASGFTRTTGFDVERARFAPLLKPPEVAFMPSERLLLGSI